VCGDSDGAFFEIHGRIRVPIYQQGESPYEFPENGGGIDDSNGVPGKVRDEMVCFAMTVPKSAAPPEGWPLVVFGHGTGGSFRSFVGNGVAEALATASTPMVVVGFEGVVHGARRGASTRDPDNLMFNVINPRAARDNHLQGAVDVLQLLRLPEVGPITVGGVGDVAFDAARTAYFGHSQGSNVGTPALAVSGAVEVAVLSGAGAFLSSSLLTKTSPVDAKAGLSYLLSEPEFDASHPVMTLWQTYFDSTDTVNYAPLLIRNPPAGVPSKHVFMSYGPGDTYSPPPSLEQMARAAGLEQAAPVIEDLGIDTVARPVTANVTGGDDVVRFGAVFQYEPNGYDGHFVATEDPAAVADWLEFLTSAAETGTPVVP
jgi:predicted esterase